MWNPKGDPVISLAETTVKGVIHTSSTGRRGLRYLSVCSGIESATVAWHSLGWIPAAFAEIDKFPSAVLAHHYPHVPNLGDFTKIEASDVGAIDLLVGGTPCQDFSVAGKRVGMDGARGNLALEFCRLARRLRPRWIVFENVPGLHSQWSGAPDGGELSPGGRERGTEDSDFGAFLDALEECGYSACWRVLDSQYVRVDTHPRAVPQRRERVFVVGYLGDWRPPCAVLLEPEGLRWDPPPRRQARQAVAGSLGAGSKRSGSRVGRREAAANHIVAGTLNANGKAAGSATQQDAEMGMLVPLNGLGGVSHALRARHSPAGMLDPNGDTLISMGHSQSHANAGGQLAVAHSLNAKGGAGRMDYESETLLALNVAHSLTGGGFDASEDGTGRGTPIIPLLANGAHGSNSAGIGVIGDPSMALDSSGAMAIAFDTTQITSKANRCQPEAGGTGHPLPARGHAPALAFHARQDPDSGPVTHPLDTDGFSIGVQQAWAVRRLTPTECERLQAFPDGYTAIPYRGKMAADGPRYRALGNSFSTHVIRWIGQRIDMFESLAAAPSPQTGRAP